MKWVIRVPAIVVLCVCAVWGFFLVQGYSGTEDAGVVMLRLMYEYDSITDVYAREDAMEARCSKEVWAGISPANEAHWNGAWERTKNFPTKVRVVLSRPGMVIYALDNAAVHPSLLWCFEYETHAGIFTSIREYQLVGTRNSEDGGFF